MKFNYFYFVPWYEYCMHSQSHYLDELMLNKLYLICSCTFLAKVKQQNIFFSKDKSLSFYFPSFLQVIGKKLATSRTALCNVATQHWWKNSTQLFCAVNLCAMQIDNLVRKPQKWIQNEVNPKNTTKRKKSSSMSALSMLKLFNGPIFSIKFWAFWSLAPTSIYI